LIALKNREENAMKLKRTDTGRMTTIKNNEFGWLEYYEAANRLVDRDNPGHFAHRAVGWDNLPKTFTAEICRAAGDLTEHVDRVEFQITNEVSAAAAAMGRVKSKRKTASSRENGKKGGRPKKSA
jgi:hypothetical protein